MANVTDEEAQAIAAILRPLGYTAEADILVPPPPAPLVQRVAFAVRDESNSYTAMGKALVLADDERRREIEALRKPDFEIPSNINYNSAIDDVLALNTWVI